MVRLSLPHRRGGPTRSWFAGSVMSIILLPLLFSACSGTTTTAFSPNCALVAPTVTDNSGNLKPDVIYQIMVDRFFNGNPANDNPPNDQGLNDPTHQDWQKFWGGDIQGITAKIPYLQNMGVTALWISPIVENIHTLINGQYAPYHGYSARDDYQLDPHFGTWAEFDTMIATAHAAGIKVLIDFAANHSNPRGTGEDGAIYKNGTLLASYGNDPNGWFHHTPNISDFNDLYDVEYQTLEGLADFAQENPAVDAYLKGAMANLISHGVDGFRMDAVKHMPSGWVKTVDDTLQATGPHYIVGEWIADTTTDPLYPDAVHLANTGGIAELNFPVLKALDDVYAGIFSPREVDSVLQQEAKDYLYPNDQANFIDNHDRVRFLSQNPSKPALHEALAVMMGLPGTPIIYYGTEQYLYNSTNGGGDPYDRPMMASFDQTTPAYQLVRCMANLRHTNPALAYGDYHAVTFNKNVYVYQRQFGQNVVVVAVNKSGDTSYPLTNLATHLPAGSYPDYLRGLQSGGGITVASGGAIASVTLKPNEIAVWQYTAANSAANPITPIAGSVAPALSHAGETMIVNGQGFGATAGTVTIGTTAATVTNWQPTAITVTVPSMPSGLYDVRICLTATTCAAPIKANVASAAQIPVDFSVAKIPNLSATDQAYVVGAIAELGGGVVTNGVKMLDPPTAPAPFVLASMPACATITYSYAVKHSDGTITQEGGTHSYTVPCAGEGSVNDTWRS